MERNLILAIMGGILLLLAAAILLPGGRTVDQHPRLPWAIETGPAGSTRVFGIELGRTTLAEARTILSEQGVTNLFRSPAGGLTIESYFEKVFLSGLRADFVLETEVDTDTMQWIYDEGLRVSQLGGGTRKVRLTTEDLERVGTLPIRSITYLPYANLDEALVEARFGPPGRKIVEEKGISHWLYPDKGLDVAINPDGKDVLTYVAPTTFSRVIEPLEQRSDPTD